MGEKASKKLDDLCIKGPSLQAVYSTNDRGGGLRNLRPWDRSTLYRITAPGKLKTLGRRAKHWRTKSKKRTNDPVGGGPE